MKSWWQSKTLWFNALMVTLTAIEASFNLLQPALPVNVYGVVLFCVSVGNVILRFLTTQAVGK